MNTIQYKSFYINVVHTDSCVRYHVNAKEAFNEDGYATESAAKVAITKHVKAQEAAYQAEAAERYEDVCFTPVKDLFAQVVANLPIKAPKPAPQSRNKREGIFVGCADGRAVRFSGPKWAYHTASARYVPANRKQRKAAQIAAKNDFYKYGF